MNTRIWFALALVLVSTSLLAAGAAPPAPHLESGQWAYHSVTTIASGMMAGRTITHDWKACAGKGEAMHQALVPRRRAGHTTCSQPTLSHDGTRYRTVMTCTTSARGITSTLKEDFTLAATDAGTTFTGHGTVDQDVALPTGSQRMHMKIDVSGHRMGACPVR